MEFNLRTDFKAENQNNFLTKHSYTLISNHYELILTLHITKWTLHTSILCRQSWCLVGYIRWFYKWVIFELHVLNWKRVTLQRAAIKLNNCYLETEMLLLANNIFIITLYVKMSFIFIELNVIINLQSVLYYFVLPEGDQAGRNML